MTNQGGSSSGTIYPALTTLSGTLAANVTMTLVNTRYDAVSLALTAGTWLVTGGITVLHNALCDYTFFLWDGTTVFVSLSESCNVSYEGCGTLSWPIVVAASSTVRIGAIADVAGPVIRAAPPNNSQGNNSTWLQAVRIA